jgi:hypothetical protein
MTGGRRRRAMNDGTQGSCGCVLRLCDSSLVSPRFAGGYKGRGGEIAGGVDPSSAGILKPGSGAFGVRRAAVGGRQGGAAINRSTDANSRRKQGRPPQ